MNTKKIKFKKCLRSGWPLPGLLFLITMVIFSVNSKIVYADEIGGLIDYRQIDRKNADTGAVGTRYIIETNKLLFNYQILETLKFDYLLENEDWSLYHVDGTKYFSLKLQRHNSQLFYQATPDISIKIALPLIKTTKEDALYQNTSYDDKNDFILPLVHGKMSLTDFFFELAAWQENDVQSLQHFQYIFLVYQYAMVGVGYEVSKSHIIRFNRSTVDTIYPIEYENNHYENFVQYRIITPMEINDTFNWVEMSVDYKETVYSDTTVKKIQLNNYLKFKLWDLTHFITSSIQWTDTITQYSEKELKYSLIEESVKKTDITNIIKYAGFTRLDTSAYFLSWKYEIQDSMTQNEDFDQKAQIKIVYTF